MEEGKRNHVGKGSKQKGKGEKVKVWGTGGDLSN